MIPTLCDGSRCSTGKPNPVTLVSTVVHRKRVVHPSRRTPDIIPNTTIKPEAMPIRLITTCSRVNASSVIPRVMVDLVSFSWSEGPGTRAIVAEPRGPRSADLRGRVLSSGQR